MSNAARLPVAARRAEVRILVHVPPTARGRAAGTSCARPADAAPHWPDSRGEPPRLAYTMRYLAVATGQKPRARRETRPYFQHPPFQRIP
ncbi:hypothetical protein PT2222_90110 [Paraburkholderia tropica]